MVIEKEKLEKLYIDMDKTTYQISNDLNCSRKTVSNFLKRYGIKIKRYKRKYSEYYNQKLTDLQKNLLIGSLLGDGCVAKHHNSGENKCRFIECHSIKQLGYLEFKKNILSNFIFNKIRYIDNSKNKSFGNGISVTFETVLHKEFDYFYDMFYKNNKKIVPNLNLTPFSLAIWYYDDGSLSFDNEKSVKPKIKLHTEGFDDNSINNCQKILNDSFGISSFVVNNKGYKIISLNTTETEKMISIVKDIKIPCMAYKLFSYNPVETENESSRTLELKYYNVNTFGSSDILTEDDGIVQSSRK